MLIPDVNLLVYAYNLDAPFHEGAKRWWEESLSGRSRVGLPWVVVLGFLRLMTSRSVLLRPLEPAEAIAIIRSWLERPQAHVVEPGPEHLAILDSLAGEIGVAGGLTTDLHIAALAIELNATVYSNDADFRRFSGLRVKNPL